MLPDNWCMRLLTYYSYCMYISEIPRHYQCSGFFFLIFRNHTFHLWDIETALCWLCTYTRNPTISLISNHSECVSLCCVTMCESNFYLFICTVLIVDIKLVERCDPQFELNILKFHAELCELKFKLHWPVNKWDTTLMILCYVD